METSYEATIILLRLKSTLHTTPLSLIYKTYILPVIEYACIALTPLSIAALGHLERVQRKAARICPRLPLYTPLNHSTLLHRLKWPTMFSARCKVKLTLLAHSIKYQYAPQHIRMLNIPAQATAFDTHALGTSHPPEPIAVKTPHCTSP